MSRRELAEIIEEVMDNNNLDPSDHDEFVSDLLDAIELRTDIIDEEDEDKEEDVADEDEV